MSVEFSVVIPTYRRPKELAEAISSVLSQTQTTVEIIVIDDSPEGSARDTVEKLRDVRVKYLKNLSPSGGVPSVVRNLGWPHAKGEFVHFLDDDDVVAEGYYLAVKEAFSAHPDVGLVFGRIEPFGTGPYAQLKREEHYFAVAARRASACQRFGRKWAFAGRMLFGNALLVCSASVSRRRCVERLGGFDPEIRLMEDADFHLRAVREFGTHFIDKLAIRYRIGTPSLMHSPVPDKLQLRRERAGRRRMQVKYREQRGGLEFYALALFTRTVLGVS
jgi:glycosyltransferase involved in cell wall biosynthesis